MGRNPAHGRAPLSRVGGILHQGGERRNQAFALKSWQVFPLVLAPAAGNLRRRPEPETRWRWRGGRGLRVAVTSCLVPRAGIGFSLAGRLRHAGLEGSCSATAFEESTGLKTGHYKEGHGTRSALRRADLRVASTMARTGNWYRIR